MDGEGWLVIGDWCPFLGFGSFFIFFVSGETQFADLAEAEQVVERAGVVVLEAGCLAVQHE